MSSGKKQINFMKHIGILLLLIVGFNFIDLICIDKSALHGTGYHGKYQKLIPTGAAGVIFFFVELIYWIFQIFIIE